MHRIKIQNRDWSIVQAFYDQDHSMREVEKEFNISISTLYKAQELDLFKPRTPEEGRLLAQKRPRKPISAESRRKMSDAKKKWNRENPEKVREVFSRLSKAKSIPCEHLKNWLKQKDIPFIEEYQPLLSEDRFYSIDIAFPDKKIGVEVNGDMHYDREGRLREYYQIRHDTIENRGWKLYEVPRKFVFNEEKMNILFRDILSAEDKQNFDFLAYIPPVKKKDLPKKPKEPRAKKPSISKFIWPPNEILSVMVYEKSLTAIAKEHGAVANTLKKHCRKQGIIYPPRGYWRRRECGYSREEALVSHKRAQVPRHSMSDKEIELASELRLKGYSFTKIGHKLGFSHSCVADTLRKKGVIGKANWTRNEIE